MNINVQREVVIVKKKKLQKYAYDKEEIYDKMKSYIIKTCADESYLDQLNEITSVNGYCKFFVRIFGKKAYHMYITRG